MITTGRVCVKTHGRDAGKKAIVLSILDKNNVLVDGEVRRKKCGMSHLEPTTKTLNIKENASREEVKAAFKSELAIDLKDKKSKQATTRQKTKKPAAVLSKPSKAKATKP